MKSCPLCGTPVWDPVGNGDGKTDTAGMAGSRYSGRMPHQYRNTMLPQAIIVTVFTILAGAIISLLCMQLYGALKWGGYVLFGLLQFYVMIGLPMWFKKPNPVIFLPVMHLTAAVYLFYICAKTGGHWYWSFAFPIVLATCVLFTGFTVFIKYVKGGRYFLFGAFFLLSGGYILLIELFEHVTFGTQMFLWSQYPAVSLAGIGIFLILAGIIHPLQDYLNRNFYI